jgi:hypothetical protein
MIEIFKTNVNNKQLANKVLKALHSGLPGCCFNFDLDDCDHTLRAQTEGCNVEIKRIIQIVTAQSVEISLFED